MFNCVIAVRSYCAGQGTLPVLGLEETGRKTLFAQMIHKGIAVTRSHDSRFPFSRQNEIFRL